MTVMMTSGKLSSRLPNSIQVLNSVCSAFLLATTSAAEHLGQSGQPRPDDLGRTAAPVDIIAATAMPPARAIRRIDVAVGASTGRANLEVSRRDLQERKRSAAGKPLMAGRRPPAPR